MAKFEVGDTVVGNSKNNYGIAGEDCELTVTKTGPSTFEGIIQYHPDNDDHEGTLQKDLKYEWFDLKGDSDEGDWWEDEEETPTEKTYKLYQRVSIARNTSHHDSTTKRYEGLGAKLLSYDQFEDGEWECTILFDDGEVVTVYESELNPPLPVTKPAPITMREEDAPKDVKAWGRTREEIIITPAHKQPVPVREAYIPVPSYEKVLDLYSTKKRGHIPLNLD